MRLIVGRWLWRDEAKRNSKAAKKLIYRYPNLDSATIAMHLIRSMDDSLLLGPILSGTAKSAHMVTTTLTAKGIFNMSAIAVADAWQQRQGQAR